MFASPSSDDADRPASRWQYQPLVLVLGAACGGIVLDRWLSAPLWTWFVGALACWTAWCLGWRRHWLRGSAVLLLGSVAATAGAWHHCRWALFSANELGRFAPHYPGPVAVELRAVSGARRIPPSPYDPLQSFVAPERSRIDVEVIAVRNRDRWQPAAGHATVLVSGHVDHVLPGDRLQAFAQGARVRGPSNPGEFDFAALARGRRELVRLQCEFPECVTNLGGGWKWPWTDVSADLVDNLRRSGDDLLWRNLSPLRSPLAAAMFLGARDELDPDLRQAFVETGTIHLLVVSGLNVGILAGSLLFVMRLGLVPRGWALGIVAVACVLYAAVTGSEPPVVRATVMVLVACLALALSRQPLGYNTLAAAGIVVLVLNPSELFSAGTQLSFLSVGVLAFVSHARWGRRELDPLERLIARTRPWPQRLLRRSLSDIWRGTLAATLIWLVIAPLVMSQFHLVSPVAILLGPVLAVPVGCAMASGFGIFLFGWLFPPLAVPLGWFCDMNLAAMQVCVESARDWPLSHFWVAGPPAWWLAVFYGVLLGGVLLPGWRPPLRWTVALAAAWVAIGLTASLASQRGEEQLRCTFLAVGHGAAVVVELPGGQTLLYDAGRLGSPAGAARIVTGYLWSRGITHLDAVVISHADADHYNAVPAVLDQISVGAVYVSPVMFEDRASAALGALRQAIAENGAPLREVWSGNRLRTSPLVSIEVLHPPRRGVLGSDNANSIVLAIEFQGRRLLLTGDLEPPGLSDVLAELPYDCDVTLAPHHGSAASDPPGFLAWSTPEIAVVSGGFSDRVPEINRAFSQQGCQVLHTAELGAVTATIAGGQVSIGSFYGE